jgi:hypothetical protein
MWKTTWEEAPCTCFFVFFLSVLSFRKMRRKIGQGKDRQTTGSRAMKIGEVSAGMEGRTIKEKEK